MDSAEDRRHSSPGLPHSGIPGSKPACGSPRLIAACHVLHRPSVPRHPPCALTSFIPIHFPERPTPPLLTTETQTTLPHASHARTPLIPFTRLNLRFSNSRRLRRGPSFDSRPSPARGGHRSRSRKRSRREVPSVFRRRKRLYHLTCVCQCCWGV